MGAGDWEALSSCIEAGDLDGVLGVVEALSEADRKQLSKRVLAAVRDRRHNPALALAEFGVCPLSRVRRHMLAFDERYARLLRARDRTWRQGFVDRASSNTVNQWARTDLLWETTYGLVRAQLVDRPASGWYVAAGCLEASAWQDDPDWLEHDLWRIFEVEEAAERLSYQCRVWWGRDPTVMFCELADSGTVSRDRMLDAALSGLRRDFAPKATLFFRQLFVALDPTAAERADLVDELLALLSNENVASVAFALEQLTALAHAGRLAARPLFDSLPAALSVSVKVHALSAVRLADVVLQRDRAAATLGLPALIDGLVHERPEVQRATLGVIKRHASALTNDDRQRLSELLPDVDPGLRPAVSELAGNGHHAVSSVATMPAGVPVPGRRLSDPLSPRLAGADALSPVRSPDELLDRLEVAFSERVDAEEVELLIDALFRFPADAFDQARVGSRRYRQVVTSWLWGVERPDEVLQYLYLERFAPPRHRHGIPSAGNNPLEAVLVRMRELLGPRPYPGLLSAPTHPGGWIDPLEAVRRIGELSSAAMPMDLAQMVLRLAPDRRDTARKAATAVHSEEALVLARALGADTQPPDTAGRLAPAWSAAEQARKPDAHLLPLETTTDLQAVKERIRMRELPRLGSPHPFLRPPLPDVAVASPADLLRLDAVWWEHSVAHRPGVLEQWLTTVWPANREACYRLVARRLWLGSDEDSSDGISEILNLMFDPREPVGPQALLALGLAYGAGDIALRALAAELTIATIVNRRIDGPALGATLAYILREHQARDRRWGQLISAVPDRWAQPLADVADSSALGAHDIQNAIETLLAGARDTDRRRISGVVRLLRRLALDADAAVTSQTARDYLAGYSPATAGGRVAQEILSVSGDGARRSRAAVTVIELTGGAQH